MIVHLVRHGRPLMEPDRPPARWELSADGEAEIARLAGSGALPTDALWVCSTEPKALGTARLLTDRPVLGTDQLREMRRPGGMLPEQAFTAAVRASLLDPDRPGHPEWETGSDTARRMGVVVDTYVPEAGSGDLVLVGHGTALTLLLATLTGQAPDVATWERLSMPDHCSVRVDPDGDAGGQPCTRVLSAWGDWRR